MQQSLLDTIRDRNWWRLDWNAGRMRSVKLHVEGPMSDAVARIFEQELERRGVAFRIDDGPLHYVVQHQGRDLFVSLDNLTREYERDPDDAHVSRFVDVVLSAEFSPPSWEQARTSILFCLEPSDYAEPPPFRTPLSKRVDRVLVYIDASRGAIDWITPKMLEEWRVGRDEAEAIALSNLAAALASASIQHHDIEGVRLGYAATAIPFKSALTLAPNLREIVSPILGWPLHAVVPDRDFLYLWDARHTTFMNRVGSVVVKEFDAAPYPLTTEVFEIGDDGIAAIGAF
jgi:hypothetical protein